MRHRLANKIRLLKIYKSYYHNDSNPTLLLKIKSEITELKTQLKNTLMSNFIIGQSVKDKEIVLRQYLMLNLFDRVLSGSVIYSLVKKKYVFLICPNVWAEFLKKYGVKVNPISHLIFLFSIKKYLIKGLLIYIHSLKSRDIDSSSYVTYMDITESCLPYKNCDNEPQYNLINWCLKNWEVKPDEIRHNINVDSFEYNGVNFKQYNYIFPKISGLNLVKYHLWFLLSFIWVILISFLGFWRVPILFSEAVMAAWYKYSLPNNRCYKYVFTINGHIYRPLWTYYCSEKIDFLFYAGSYPQYETIYGVPPPELGYTSMTWPKLFMWDNDYAKWTEGLLNRIGTQIIKTNSIWYSDAKLAINYNTKKKHIILFDVPPAKLSSLLPMGSYPLYRTYVNCTMFLEHVYRWAVENDYVIVWKKKRNKSFHSNMQYWTYCNNFENRSGVIAVDSNVSAYKLIKEFGGPVISAPFTSTAFIARELNVESIFYDPSGSIFKSDRGCQGVKLISGSMELGDWFNNLEPRNSSLFRG